MIRAFCLLLGLALLASCRPAAPVTPESPLRPAVQASLELAEHYFTQTAFRDKGLLRYRYDPASNRYTSANNELRQLMGSRLLGELAGQDPSLLDKHRRNLDFVFEFWYRTDGDIGFVQYGGKSKLGANAMALRALVYSPDFELHRDRAGALANGILALRNPDGSLRPWLREPDYEYDAGYLMTFYSGEAILALVEYADRIDDPGLLELARRSQEYYLGEYVTRLDENYYPAYVPWHSQSLSRLYALTGDRRYAEAVFTLNDKLLELQDGSDHPGRFYNPETPEYGSPHASSDAVYAEGLAYALELAEQTGDSGRSRSYRRALELALRHLIRLQYKQADVAGITRPDRAVGGLRTSDTDPRIRIDNVQHAIDAYTKALAVLGR